MKHVGICVLSFAVICALPLRAQAGLWDAVNQATGKINEANNKVNQVKRAKQQVEGMGSSLPKPPAKTKNAAVPAAAAAGAAVGAGGFELTPTTNPIKGEWGTQVTCAGPNSATCQNGMDNIMNCMNQSRGYFYRLVEADLNLRLEQDKELTKEEKDMLKEDIASVKAAIKTDKVVDPDPETPQRYLSWLAEEDQQEIQKLNLKYISEVRKDCDDRFGGMSRYSR